MKVKDVPQDDAGFFEPGKLRDVCYAVDEDGNYKQVLSMGWEPKNEAIKQAWEQINEKVEEIKEKVISGKASPIAYYMVKNMMSTGILAKYTGFSRLKVRRHLKPRIFKTLDETKLNIYAKVFNITLEDLLNIK